MQNFEIKMKEYKVGDQVVIVNGSSSGQPFKIMTITKVTSTRIETNDKRQFMRNSRKLVRGYGGYADHLPWNEVSVEEALKLNTEWHDENDARIARIRRNNVANTNWHSISDEKIIRIHAILSEVEK